MDLSATTSDGFEADSDSQYLPLRILNNSRPATSLPPELLGMIFELACAIIWKDHEPREWQQSIDRRIRRAICSTCHQWRSVAICTASLWSRIHICIEGPSITPVLLPMVELEIERAARQPIMLKVWVQGDVAPDKEFQSLLHGILSRCRSVFLCWNLETLDNCFLFAPGRNHSPPHFPRLHTLVLILTPPSNTQTGTPQSHAACIDLTLAPLLQELAIHRSSIPVRLNFANNITKLSLVNNVSVENDIFVLQHCHQLRELNWSPHDSFHVTPSDELAKTQHPHLLHLSLGLGDNPVSQIAALQALSTPHLRSMRLDCPVIPSGTRFPDLESLSVYAMESDPSVATMLHTLPGILRLTLRFGFDEIPDFLPLFLERDEHGHFNVLPHLRDLTVYVEKVDGTINEWVDAIVLVRNEGGAEGPGMDFTLHLPRTDDGFSFNVGLEDARSRHPWSIDDREIDKDRFFLGSVASWTELDS